MRDLHTDRPDQTESAHTVDPGHFQIESDLVNVVLDRDRSSGGDVSFESWSVGAVNVKAGLWRDGDIQMIWEPEVRVRLKDHVTGSVDEFSGSGDWVTRLKWNLWGNDEGRTALALMPFVKWPLGESRLRNGKTEGGLIVPFGMDWAGGWGMGAMTEVDFVRGEVDGYDLEWVNSVTVGKDLTSRLGMYLEFFTVSGDAPGKKWEGQVDVGWTLALRRGVQLDWGCNFGVTSSAPDFNPFLGMSFRF